MDVTSTEALTAGTTGNADDVVTTIITSSESNDLYGLYVTQLLLTIVGLVANVFTLAALIAIGRQFTPCIRLLLIHQSWIDSWVCLQGLILQVQPYKWNTGTLWFDTFVCHIWHSQTVFWGSVDVSVFGLVLIAFERYMATCHPLKHLALRRRTLLIAIIGVNVFTMTILMAPSYFQASMQDGVCTTDFYFPGNGFKNAMTVYPIIIFVTTYFIPCCLFVFFYGSILRLLHKRKHQHELGDSQIVSKANTEILKTAIVVTLFFTFALSFDKWYYVLGHLGVFKYLLNTPIQKVGVFMTVLNSTVNPFIYLLFMAAFRRRFFLWIRGRCRPIHSPTSSSHSQNNSTASERLHFYTRAKQVQVNQVASV